MKHVMSLAAVAFALLASACAVKSERTVVERPSGSAAVYTTTPATTTTTTVITPR